MTHMINKISRFVYDRGIVYFSLENETPGPQGSVKTETISDICLRFEDFREIIEFLTKQKTIVTDFDIRWRESLLNSIDPNPKTMNSDKIKEDNEVQRPPIGYRIGPRE